MNSPTFDFSKVGDYSLPSANTGDLPIPLFPPGYATQTIGCVPSGEHTPHPSVRRRECEYFLHAILKRYGSPPSGAFLCIVPSEEEATPITLHEEEEEEGHRFGRVDRDGAPLRARAGTGARTATIHLTDIVLYYPSTSIPAQLYAYTLYNIPHTWELLCSAPPFDWEREYPPKSPIWEVLKKRRDAAVQNPIPDPDPDPYLGLLDPSPDPDPHLSLSLNLNP